ncbi:Protein CBG26328 [Caenorhabditis briggsae]|jgi:hypothetical protein
MASI